jgi:hypothetical protein
MGQYHGLFNLDKKEMVFPHELGFGAKQWEHTGFAGSLSDVLYALCAFQVNRGGGDFGNDGGIFKGRWHGDRVAVVGDYAAFGDLPTAWNDAFVDHEYNGETNKVFNMARTMDDDGMEPFFTDIGDQIREHVARLWEKEPEKLMSLREKYGHPSQAILGASTR